MPSKVKVSKKTPEKKTQAIKKAPKKPKSEESSEMSDDDINKYENLPHNFETF